VDRWTFGVEPLPQTTDAADALRTITSMVLAMEGEDERVAALIAELERAKRSLAEVVPTTPAPRVGPGASGDGRVYIDHARDIGDFNPCFPPYQIEVDGDRATGIVGFPIPYEGPPGVVHGGFLAVFFDCVMQHHNCDVGVAGKTTSLALRYRRPVPLLTKLHFELHRSQHDGRIHSTGTLSRGDELLCEATMEAVAGNRADLPAVSPRRTAS
jgi:hypothetical protein